MPEQLSPWKHKIINLLMRGQEVDADIHAVHDDDITSAISLFKSAAETNPQFLLTESLGMRHSDMVTLSVAILLSCAPDSFLQSEKTKATIKNILVKKTPEQLLECVQYLKDKSFGRGFGSRPQKLFRQAMETWHPEMIEEYIVMKPRHLYSLVRLVHPRYVGYQGELIQGLLGGQFNHD